MTPAGDIVQTLAASGQFKTFIKGLDATNLTAVLKQQPHLTVLAPTDAAFAAYGDTAKLLADLPALQKLLLHHVINAEVDTAKLKGAHGPVATGAGDKVVLDGVGATFKADQANILQADVKASNGLIDVVDQVLKAGSVPETIADAAPPAEEKPAAEPAKPAAKKAPAKGTKRGH
ncbi:fasciclin domain-containing protein [Phenylobacterium soli]|uniref:Fasciclin domain-containing protein n=1 Tax=Phenylobacterium soli TaxID=2170551 RepID=A0A328ARS1_9CAUL|nr:fasciclin domain-containing protein [Phenylobacterium soli]